MPASTHHIFSVVGRSNDPPVWWKRPGGWLWAPKWRISATTGMGNANFFQEINSEVKKESDWQTHQYHPAVMAAEHRRLHWP
jgi:hypothetical protein